MKMIFKMMVTMMMLLSFAACGGGSDDNLQTESISGYWNIYSSDDYGVAEEKIGDWVISQSEATISLESSCPNDDFQTTGTLSGSELSASWTMDNGGQISMTGTFDGSNAISGNYYTDNGNGPWSAVRVSEPECPVVGNTYKVYGSNLSWFDIASAEGVEDHIVGYNAADYLDSGLTFLGESTSTETFTGSYSYYLVVVESANLVYLNAITGSDGSSFVGRFNFTGNIDNHSICSNDDSIACEMGNSGYDTYGSYIGITSTGDGLTSITVTISSAL